MQAKIIIGNTELTFEERDAESLMNLISPFSQATSCGAFNRDGSKCGSRNLAIEHRVAQGKENTDTAGQSFDFYAIKCMDCGAKAEMGSYLNKTGFYLKNWARREAQQ